MQNHAYPKGNPHSNKQKDPRSDWRTIFVKNSGGISSKRVLSVIGILTCVVIFVLAYIQEKSVPEFGEVIFVGCVSLYGIDKVPNFWTKSINKS